VISLGVRPVRNCCHSESVCRYLPGGTFTFFNPQTISTPGTGTASPYPSTISVSGLTGLIAKVTVTLFDMRHETSRDLQILLVGPDGETNTILMSDVGGDASFVTLTFDDNGPRFIEQAESFVSGTYKPTNFQTDPVSNNLPAPAPPTSASVALSNFIGLDPNGTWSLYVNDALDTIGGNIFNGWALSITLADTEKCTVTPL